MCYTFSTRRGVEGVEIVEPSLAPKWYARSANAKCECSPEQLSYVKLMLKA